MTEYMEEYGDVGREGLLGFLDFWSGEKPWWNWYLTPVVNFGEIRRTQLAQSTLLTSLSLGYFRYCKVYSEAKESGVQKAMGSYHTYSSLVKLQPWFLSLQWMTCLSAELQPWFLSLQWMTCPWVEHLMMISRFLCSTGYHHRNKLSSDTFIPCITWCHCFPAKIWALSLITAEVGPYFGTYS